MALFISITGAIVCGYLIIQFLEKNKISCSGYWARISPQNQKRILWIASGVAAMACYYFYALDAYGKRHALPLTAKFGSIMLVCFAFPYIKEYLFPAPAEEKKHDEKNNIS